MRTKSLTSVVDIVNNVEVVLHRGAVSAAEAGGEEEEQRQSCRQPAARQDAEPDISRSPGQHAADSLKGTAERSTEGCCSVTRHSLIHQDEWSNSKISFKSGLRSLRKKFLKKISFQY